MNYKNELKKHLDLDVYLLKDIWKSIKNYKDLVYYEEDGKLYIPKGYGLIYKRVVLEDKKYSMEQLNLFEILYFIYSEEKTDENFIKHLYEFKKDLHNVRRKKNEYQTLYYIRR